MTIELYFSNQLDQLADKFSDIFREEIRGKVNILEPPVVIVPNANLVTWLQLFLAEKNSICINVGFEFLEQGLWKMIAALDTSDEKPEMLDNEQRKILILQILQNLDLADPDFLPLTRYLSGKGGVQRQDYAARLWQLSEKIAHLFEEYEFHRTDMIHKWLAGDHATQAMERCQQRLYIKLKNLRDKLTQRTGRRLLAPMEYADLVLPNLKKGAGKAPKPQKVHFFGLSQISNFHLTLIGELQAYYSIHIYTMNPCQEFWEDIKTPREKRWIQRKNVKALAIQASEQAQGELFEQADNALLAAWGKPGRESVRLMCKLTAYDFNTCFTDAKQSTGILQQIQNHILTLSPSIPQSKRSAQDRSLQIVACPSIYREVETVYNSILLNLAQNNALQLTDIAILVPDISAYKPVIDSVFNRLPRQITYNLVDSKADIESLYGKALLAILKMATGRFSRNEVFELILNPCFMSRWKIGPEEIQIWAAWTKELQIFHTFDRAAKVAKGYPASDSFTWKQGLQRLCLSRIMAAPEVTDPGGFNHYQGHVPFSDLNSGDADLVQKFCMAIEGLNRAVSRLNVKGVSGAQWKQRFFDTCEQLVEIPVALKGEAAVRQALIRAFEKLSLYDRLFEDASQATLDVEFIMAFIRANLGSISGAHGNYLTGGVTVAALQPMRPIPFHTVYVLGMEEGRFPGKADLSSLDLRLLKRRIGDISLPERNCYLFLEMLLAVQAKLYITYVAKDLQKDRRQQPCSVVNQLQRYVELELLADGQPFQVAEVPLTGSSVRYLDSEAINAWSDVLVNDFLSDRVALYRIQGLWETFKKQAATTDLEKIARFDPDLSLEAALAAEEERNPTKIALYQLKKFIEHPVRLKIQHHLGLFDEQETIEDVALREDEPFFSEFPLDYRLKMDPLKLWLDAHFASIPAGTVQPDPEVFYHRVYASFGRKSRTPEGVFADIERDALKNHVSNLAETLNPVLAQMTSAKQLFRSVTIGEPADEPIPADNRLALKKFNPLALSIQTMDAAGQTLVRDVSLHGQLPWVWQASDDNWHVLVLTGSGKKSREPDKYVIGPVLFYLMCLAGENSSQWIASSSMTLHVVYREVAKQWTYRFDQETATAYLTELVSAILNQSMAAWLPFDIVTSRKRSIQPHKIPADEVRDDMRAQFAVEIEDAFAEEADYLIRLAKPIIPADAFDSVRKYIKVYFDLN